MASIVRKSLTTGGTAYLVRYRMADGQQRSKQFARRKDADRFATKVSSAVDDGTMIDPRLDAPHWTSGGSGGGQP